MQTFLPLPDFRESGIVLDSQRLGKQRVEALQLVQALTGEAGWMDHPAARMWRGYVPALLQYGECICWVWRERGYEDSLLPWFQSHPLRQRATAMPYWMGRPSFHLAHRSNLVRKAPLFYGPLWPDVPDSLPYEWPW